jgi:hypothetical protein
MWDNATTHKVVIVLADGDDPTLMERMVAKLEPLATSAKWLARTES